MSRRKGRDISGWLIVDKPAGISSNAVVNKVRWALSARKAGHAGTLDPAATGVLAVAIGEATKTVPYVTDALKAYRFTVRLGQATNTDDAEGEVTAESAMRPDTGDIRAALARFTGDIMQVPPKYSAVKIDGERAYRLARDGGDPQIAARPLHVARLDLVERGDPNHVTIDMVCGKGGYVRAIARDLGTVLGCHGHVRELRRLWSGPFTLDQAVGLETVEAEAQCPALDARLIPVQTALASLPELRCTAEGAARMRNGNPGPVITAAEYGAWAWASHEGVPVAVGRFRGGDLHPDRVFNFG